MEIQNGMKITLLGMIIINVTTYLIKYKYKVEKKFYANLFNLEQLRRNDF